MGIKKDREHELLDKGKDIENQKLMFSTANYTSIPNVVKTQINDFTFSVKNGIYYCEDEFVLTSSLFYLIVWGESSADE